MEDLTLEEISPYEESSEDEIEQNLISQEPSEHRLNNYNELIEFKRPSTPTKTHHRSQSQLTSITHLNKEEFSNMGIKSMHAYLEE